MNTDMYLLVSCIFFIALLEFIQFKLFKVIKFKKLVSNFNLLYKLIIIL